MKHVGEPAIIGLLLKAVKTSGTKQGPSYQKAFAFVAHMLQRHIYVKTS